MSSLLNFENLSISQWAEEDRPREKLMLKGKAALSDAELIAILLGSGTRSMSAVQLGKLILSKVNFNLNELAKLSVKELKTFKGIGEAKAITLISALELGRRRKNADPVKRIRITCSEDIYALMKPNLLDLQHEEFWLILLNRSSQLIKKVPISTGGVSSTVVDPKIIFHAALDSLASQIILVHNHPSGNLNPSDPDLLLTKKLKSAAKLLDISLIEHLIFSDHGYYSFADQGVL